MKVIKVTPPAGDYISKIDMAWKRGSSGFGPYVTSSLEGGMLGQTLDFFLFGELGGEIAGWLGCILPADAGDLGTLGFVHTLPAHRRKGISTALIRACLAEFKSGGGIAMHLATRNPDACRLYARCGFRELGTPWIMRYETGILNNFEEEYYEYAGAASVRRANWGDFPRMGSLYSMMNHPWKIRDYPRGIWQDERKYGYEKEALGIMELQQEIPGAAVVMENERKRVVGCASLLPDSVFTGARSADFDFFVAPAYFNGIPALVENLKTSAMEHGIEQLRAWVHEEDREKVYGLVNSGFRRLGKIFETRLRSKAKIPLELYAAGF